jgi:hypothetical protein
LKNLVVANVLWDIPYVKFICNLAFIAVFAGWREEIQKRFRRMTASLKKT